MVIPKAHQGGDIWAIVIISCAHAPAALCLDDTDTACPFGLIPCEAVKPCKPDTASKTAEKDKKTKKKKKEKTLTSLNNLL